jgi:nucleoside-diphosphate-sugar epimerase
MSPRALVTGGSGYFGSVLVDALGRAGWEVRVFDLNPPDPSDVPVDFVQGDIRDRDAILEACTGMDVVHHNVAQVPLAKDPALFDEVNEWGTANLLVAARTAGVGKVVYTSSSAVFGRPASNPVTEETLARPLEAYGRAKLRGEILCAEAVATGLDVTIIRPRTILGHGRLGIMSVLFELVAGGGPVFVLGGGSNVYQFVHASDLADACRRAGERQGAATYNIGALEFGTMRETLQALVEHAGTGSKVRSVPKAPTAAAMHVFSALGLAPFAPYHWLMYGQSLWFDVTKAQTELGWVPQHANTSMLIESYEWFLQHRADTDVEGRSRHRSPVPAGVLRLLRYLP